MSESDDRKRIAMQNASLPELTWRFGDILASRYKCDRILLDTALFPDFIPATGTKDKFTFHQYHRVPQILSSTPYAIQK